MADKSYNRGKARLATTPWATGDYRVLLVDDTYIFDAEQNTVSEVTADELVGTGYQREALANKSVSEDDANSRALLKADPVLWETIDAGTAGAAIVYEHVDDLDDALNHLISFHDSGFPKITNGGNLDLGWAGAGRDDVISLKQPA